MRLAVKMILAGIGIGLFGTALFIILSGIGPSWVWWVPEAAGLVVIVIGVLIPLKGKETITMTVTPSPMGQPVTAQQLTALNAFGPFGPLGPPNPQVIAVQRLAEEAEKLELEPEGEPRTLVGLTGWRFATVASLRPLVLVGAAGGHVIGRYSEPAFCDQGHKHEVPAWSCHGRAAGCGYYVLNEPPLLDTPTVLVRVSLAGRTIRCDGGYRTFRYRLEEIWLPPITATNTNIEEAEERFGVPIYVLERMLPDGDRAKKGSHNLHTAGDADTASAEEGADIKTDNSSS